MNELNEIYCAEIGFNVAKHLGELGSFLTDYLGYSKRDPEMREIYCTEIDFIEWLSMKPCPFADAIIVHCSEYHNGMCKIGT